jgi:hypothetical protein
MCNVMDMIQRRQGNFASVGKYLKGADLIFLAQDRDQLWAVVNTIMKFQIP